MEIQCTEEVVLGPIDARTGVALMIVASAPLDGTAYVTAVANGEHMEGSKHTPSNDTGYKVQAMDIDCVDADINRDLFHFLAQALPGEFDVFLEDAKTENEHIHLEVDPADPNEYALK